MSTLREAAQQALEALEQNLYAVANQAPHVDVMGFNAAIMALRAALAEPKEKPWRCACGANLYIDENGAPRSKA